MINYYVIQRDFSFKEPEKQFSFHCIKAVNQKAAWRKVERWIERSMSQDWLLDSDELEYMLQCIKEGKDG